MIFTFGREYGISEVGKGAVSCSPNFQIPRNLKLDTRTETRARPNSSLENPQISFEDRVENYWPVDRQYTRNNAMRADE